MHRLIVCLTLLSSALAEQAKDKLIVDKPKLPLSCTTIDFHVGEDNDKSHLNVYKDVNVASVEECAQACFNDGPCQRAGFFAVDENGFKCLLSYAVNTDCELAWPLWTTGQSLPAIATLSCLQCNGVPKPFVPASMTTTQQTIYVEPRPSPVYPRRVCLDLSYKLVRASRTDTPLNMYKTVTVSDVAQCAHQCYDDPLCVEAGFAPTIKQCFLSSGDSNCQPDLADYAGAANDPVTVTCITCNSPSAPSAAFMSDIRPPGFHPGDPDKMAMP